MKGVRSSLLAGILFLAPQIDAKDKFEIYHHEGVHPTGAVTPGSFVHLKTTGIFPIESYMDCSRIGHAGALVGPLSHRLCEVSVYANGISLPLAEVFSSGVVTYFPNTMKPGTALVSVHAGASKTPARKISIQPYAPAILDFRRDATPQSGEFVRPEDGLTNPGAYWMNVAGLGDMSCTDSSKQCATLFPRIELKYEKNGVMHKVPGTNVRIFQNMRDVTSGSDIYFSIPHDIPSTGAPDRRLKVCQGRKCDEKKF